MQLTRFDRWLREKYVYETHIHTLRPPESIPKGVRTVEIPDVPGKRYKHLFVTRSSKLADELIAVLKADSQMYTTRIVDRKSWYVPIIAPKNKSVTWWLFSAVVIAIFILFRNDLYQRPCRGCGIPEKLHGGAGSLQKWMTSTSGFPKKTQRVNPFPS